MLFYRAMPFSIFLWWSTWICIIIGRSTGRKVKRFLVPPSTRDSSRLSKKSKTYKPLSVVTIIIMISMEAIMVLIFTSEEKLASEDMVHQKTYKKGPESSTLTCKIIKSFSILGLDNKMAHLLSNNLLSILTNIKKSYKINVQE